MKRTSPRTTISILLLFTGLYLFTMRGTHTSVDDIPRFNLTISLITSASIEVPPSIMASVTSVDGRVYSKYGLGMSLAMAPLYGAVRIAPASLTTRLMERPDVFAMSTTNQWLGALACMLLFLIARRIGFADRTALLVTLAAGLASMLWAYAQTSFENVLVAVLIEIVVLVLLGEGRPGVWHRLSSLCALPDQRGAGLPAFEQRVHLRVLPAAGAGAAMGFIFLTRWGDGWVFLPGALALAVARLRTPNAEPRRFAGPAIAFGLPLLLGIALAMAYNQARFHRPLELGYDDDNVSVRFLHRGLFGFLFSPTRSVFLFAPLLVLAVARFGRLWRRLGGGLRSLGVFWLIGAPLVIYSCFQTWDGGWCFGPRYLLPSVVLATLAAGEWLEDARWREDLWRPAVFGVLFLVGVFAQWICLTSDFNHYCEAYYSFRFDPEACPLWVLPKTYVYPAANLWFLKILVTRGIGLQTTAVLLIPLGLAGIGIVGMRRELAALATEAGEFFRRGSRSLARVVLAVAAIVALVSLAKGMAETARSKPAPEGFGLAGHYYANAHWTSPALFDRHEAPIDFDWSAGRRPVAGDFSVRWAGEICAPAAGTYVFALDACGTATLWLDGNPLLFNPGPQPGRRLYIRSTELAEGRHPITVDFASKPAVDFYEVNGARFGRTRPEPTGLQLLWKPPDAWRLRTVPARALRPKIENAK